jgi:hypothetical protein
VAERFFGRLQGERTALRHSATRHDAQDDGVEAIEMFYNSTPLHSSLGSVRPNDYEELAKVASLSVRFCLTTTGRRCGRRVWIRDTPGTTWPRRPRPSICIWRWSHAAEAKQGVVLRPRRGGARSNVWVTRCRRLVRDDARWAETLAGWHIVAFALLMCKRFVELIVSRA